MTTFREFCQMAEEQRKKQPTWRKGQTYFNVLSAVKPHVADAVRGTLRDPFHRDDRMREFLEFVHMHW